MNRGIHITCCYPCSIFVFYLYSTLKYCMCGRKACQITCLQYMINAFFHNNFFHNVADIYMGFCVIVCGFRIYCKHVHIAKGLFQAQFPLNVKSYFISTCINVLFDFLTLIKCWVLWALIEYQAWSAWARTIWCRPSTTCVIFWLRKKRSPKGVKRRLPYQREIRWMNEITINDPPACFKMNFILFIARFIKIE